MMNKEEEVRGIDRNCCLVCLLSQYYEVMSVMMVEESSEKRYAIGGVVGGALPLTPLFVSLSWTTLSTVCILSLSFFSQLLLPFIFLLAHKSV